MDIPADRRIREEIVPASSHPSERELQCFIRGELPRADVRAIVRHLLTRCPSCTDLTRKLWRLGNLPLEVLAADPQDNPAHLLGFQREHRASRAR